MPRGKLERVVYEGKTWTAGTAVAVTATLALAAASWVVALHQMDGMDMGVATELGSFAFFVAAWVPMMAAMMLPGAVPAVSRFIRTDGRLLAAPQTWLPPELSRERPLGIQVRDLLRRLEHRVDGDAAGARRHERHVDVRRCCTRPRPEALAAASVHRRAARVDDHRCWNPRRRRAVVDSRSHANDVKRQCLWLTARCSNRKEKSE
jgi:hypothetical protein